MAWYKVDDKLHSHPKARRAGLAAMGLWTLAGSHCMDYLTDGVVESWFVESWPEGTKLAARLVKVGLWDEHPEGWAFHDWAEYQPTGEDVRATRNARSEAGRKGAEKRWAGKDMANGIANAMAKEWPSDAPSPVPSPDSSKTYKSQSSSNRARETTDSVEPTEMTRRLAAQRGVTSLPAVVEAIRKHTGRDVTPEAAFQVSLWVLDKGRDPKVPQRYVTGAVSRSPHEVQQFIDENGLAS